MLRSACGADFKLVTPGIRPAGTAAHDQARVMTPRGRDRGRRRLPRDRPCDHRGARSVAGIARHQRIAWSARREDHDDRNRIRRARLRRLPRRSRQRRAVRRRRRTQDRRAQGGRRADPRAWAAGHDPSQRRCGAPALYDRRRRRGRARQSAVHRRRHAARRGRRGRHASCHRRRGRHRPAHVRLQGHRRQIDRPGRHRRSSFARRSPPSLRRAAPRCHLPSCRIRSS